MADPDPRQRARRRLARDQAALLAALVAGGPVPRGFDPERLEVQRKALLAKRAEGLVRAAPELALILGREFPGLFHAYARTRPLAAGPRRDALDFVGHLLATGVPRDPRCRDILTDWQTVMGTPSPRAPRDTRGSRRPAAVRIFRFLASLRTASRSAKGI
ncbi:hypothetical protein [Streptomyces sp. UNOC14_S4]|uniref:hypothetical protein n=1 Tax=Streptomyces sp. UNOC14_S4 TaxID=2872340 RepID=UPI001E30B9E2|nr:hypothetical protein [Streptomyces sp. UNOC14_S4]MCC3772495.1 hypothetical protein [Streptomyces sp. UNOC14_S4]